MGNLGTCLFILVFLGSVNCLGQEDTTTQNNFSPGSITIGDTRMHFSGHKGPWSMSGVTYTNPEGVLLKKSVYYGKHEDSTVFYSTKEFFDENGNKTRYILVDFKKKNKAKIVDIAYQANGKIKTKMVKSASRKPSELDPAELDWQVRK